MRLFVILSFAATLALASGASLNLPKRRRDVEEIIHHEYHGPPAPLAKDGRVIDTLEVAHARANHLAIHAETVIDLLKKMAEADEKHKKEYEEKKKEEEEKKEEGPIVVESVEISPELMAILAGEEKKEEEIKPIVEPAGEEATKGEEAKEEEKKEEEKKEEKKEEKEEEKKEEEKKEEENEVDYKYPIYIDNYAKAYEGPIAPLSEDGRVLDTPEVKKAKEAHLLAYESAVKLAKAKSSEEEGAWYEAYKKIPHPPAPVHLLYSPDGPVGYEGPVAPIDEHGRVVDTKEVQLAKAEHKKAHDKAVEIAKRHPPKAEDNAV